MVSLEALQEYLGYSFKNKELLKQALIHPSITFSKNNSLTNNQRLEFLGDSVLNFILADAIFKLYPIEREGILARNRSMLAQGSCLVHLANQFELERFIQIETNTQLIPPSALEDALEAIIGAIYLDSDFLTVREIVKNWYADMKERINSMLDTYNPKGTLQEAVKKVSPDNIIDYTVVNTAGPAHDRKFEIQVTINQKVFGRGTGSSKKEAEQEAAQIALKFFAQKANDDTNNA